jgi:hypothetical protein
MVRVARWVMIAFVASLVAGLVTGLLARGAMKILALAGGVSFDFPSGRFTVEGTLSILLVPMLQGILLALLLLAVRRFLPGAGWRKALSYGIAAFVFPGLVLLTDREFNLTPVNQYFGRLLFAPIYFAYGFIVGVVIERLDPVRYSRRTQV